MLEDGPAKKASSREQVTHRDHKTGLDQRRRVARLHFRQDNLIPMPEAHSLHGNRLPVDQEPPVRNVHDPVLRNPGTGVQRRLLPVIGHGGHRRFNDQLCCGGMVLNELARIPSHQRDVRLRLRTTEGERKLQAENASRSFKTAQRQGNKRHDHRVEGGLRTQENHFPSDELYVFILKEARLPHPVIFGP
jgi:hypothetical protein